MLARVAAVVLALGAPGPAGAASLCDDLAARLKAGDAAQEPELPVLRALAERSSGAWRVEAGQNLTIDKALDAINAAPALRKAAKSGFTDGVFLYRFGDTGYGLIEDVQGTLHCQNLTFFDARHGAARLIGAPATLRINGTHLCWRNAVWPMTFRGAAVLAEEDDAGGPWTVDLALWLREPGGWGGGCRIKARFRATLKVESAHCAPDADCTAIERHAMALARRREYRLPLAPAPTDLAAPLQAKGDDLVEMFPTFGAPEAYGMFSDPKIVAWPWSGANRVAIVGGGQLGWRDYQGHLVAVWERQGAELKPVAGVMFKRGRGALASLKVEN